MRRIIKILVKVIVLLSPLILVFYLYPPTDQIIFNGIGYPHKEFSVGDYFQKKPTFKNQLADIFSVPLSLDWYKVSITNNAIHEHPGCLISEPAWIQFSFHKGDPRLFGTTFVEGEIETKLNVYESKHPDYWLKSGDTAYFIAPSWEEYSINGGILFYGGCLLVGPPSSDGSYEKPEISYDYDISIKPHWPSWIVRLIIIYIFWIFVVSSIRSVIDLLKK